MFEWLNSFWGGAVSLAGGLLVISSAGKLLAFRPRFVAFDFRAYQVRQRNVPADVKVEYSFSGEKFSSIHITEIIIKNESGAPLSNPSFLASPLVKIGKENLFLFARQVEGIDESYGELKYKSDSAAFAIENLTVPIDASITFEIATEKPFDHSLSCIHKDVKVKRRNYGLIFRSKAMYFFVPPLFFLLSVLLSVIYTVVVGDSRFLLFVFLHELLAPLQLNEPMKGIATFALILALPIFVVFLYRIYLGASAAEIRFTEEKVVAH